MPTVTNIQPGQQVSIPVQLDSLAEGENCFDVDWSAVCGNDTLNDTQKECVTATCPDPILTSAPMPAVSGSRVTVTWGTATNTTARLCVALINDPTNFSYSNCRAVEDFGNPIHQQFVDNLPSGLYFGYVQTTSPVTGETPQDCAALEGLWRDISCMFFFEIEEPTPQAELKLVDFNASQSGIDDWEEGSFSAPAPKPNADNEQIRIVIPQGDQFGGGAKALVDPNIKHVWARWYLKLQPGWQSTQGVKVPGLSSHINGGTGGIAGGNGGGWAGLCKSFSFRGLISPNGLFRLYAYHLRAYNPANNWIPTPTPAQILNFHPCVVNPANPVTMPPQRNFGQTIGPGIVLSVDQWHCIEIELMLNTINTANPNDPTQAFEDGLVRYWVDGALGGQLIGVHMTNNPLYHNIAMWKQYFHGGDDPSPVDNIALMDCIEISDAGRIGC